MVLSQVTLENPVVKALFIAFFGLFIVSVCFLDDAIKFFALNAIFSIFYTRVIYQFFIRFRVFQK